MRRADLFDFRRIFILLMATVCVPALALSAFGILAIKHERAAVEKNLEELYGGKLEQLVDTLLAEPVPAGDDEALAAKVEELQRRLFPGEKVRFTLQSNGSDLFQSVVSRPLGGDFAGMTVAVELGDARSPASVALTNRVVYIVLLCLLYGAIAVGVVLTSRAVYREARLSRLKSDFVSHVSHELRTPLTSIRMFVETLRLGRFRDEPERRQCLDLLEKEATRLAELVDRLLEWAQVESGRKVYRKIAMPAVKVAEEALEIFERVAEKDLVELDAAKRIAPVEVDKDALSVVLLNLLMNAYKYTGADKRIQLKVRQSGKRVLFEVVDNGPGIPAAERKRIFEQFYRVDDLLSRRAEGTGLGLAIAKRITEDHGGRIEISGEPGKGSRFTIALPAQERRQAA